MSQQTATPVAGADAKLLRAKFGIQEKPIQATSAFRRVMPFDHKDISTQSWILVTPNGRTHVNTYNGKLGERVDYTRSTYPMPTDAKKVKAVFKGYEEVAVSECPVAVAIEADESTDSDDAGTDNDSAE